MSMSKRMLPTKGSEVTAPAQSPEAHGISLDEAVGEFIRLSGRRDELKGEIDDVLAVLLPEAFEVRGQQNTVRLSDHTGNTLKVEFKVAYKCDTDLLNVARELIGDDQFEKLF